MNQEDRRNLAVRDCLEANAFYNVTTEKHRAFSRGVRDCTSIELANTMIAEAYLMRVDTLTGGE